MSDFFQLFGLPPAFEIDLATLEKSYFTLQRQVHPDRAANKPEAERLETIQQSMRINEGYHTLREPLKRAQYLLSLQDISVNTEKDSIKPSETLLTEIMELREQLMEAESVDEMQVVENLSLQKHQECSDALAAAFKGASYEAAAELTIRLNYLDKILQEVQQQRVRSKRA